MHPQRERKIRYPQTIEEYETWSPKNGFKYEWKDGRLLKLDKMDAKQHHIGDNLTRFFMTTKAFAAGDSLTLESKTKTTETRRRVPDIAYFTFEQRQTMYEGIHVTPYFAIEVISKSNSAIEMFGKLTEYFDTGVEVVWYIFPDDKTVYVFDSPMSYLICRKDMVLQC
ncbi:MAG: Uma2 family endonuclease [Saprospiraceae bacterium]|nr:Uma2 family endonuclease [Saprospiraceae bacterium]